MTARADDRTPAQGVELVDDLMTRTIFGVLTKHLHPLSAEIMAEEIAHAVREALDKRRAETLRGPSTIKTDYTFGFFGI